MPDVSYRDGATALTGHLVEATGPSRAGVLVVHGGAGLDAHARTQARRLAALGHTVLACDMYGDGVAGDRERVLATIAALRSDPALLQQRAHAGLELLATRTDGTAAVVGYCFGGMVALELARSGMRLAAAASVHGSLATARPARPGAITCPVLACHGALDPHVPTTDAQGFAAEMAAAGADWQLLILGRAQHGFTHPAPAAGPGVAYDADADARSFAALAALLGTVDQ